MLSAYRDGLLVAGQDAAESLQVSFLLPEGQLQPPHLALALLHTAKLVIDGVLQTAEGGGEKKKITPLLFWAPSTVIFILPLTFIIPCSGFVGNSKNEQMCRIQCCCS